jgi:hypothetical protein
VNPYSHPPPHFEPPVLQRGLTSAYPTALNSPAMLPSTHSAKAIKVPTLARSREGRPFTYGTSWSAKGSDAGLRIARGATTAQTRLDLAMSAFDWAT